MHNQIIALTFAIYLANFEMQFNQVIGQQAIKEQLLHSYSLGRISHAQLLIGNTGYGSLALAMAYAQLVNCRQPQVNDSCGKCASCQKAQKIVHPDIHFCYPTIGSKAVSTQFISEWREMVKKNAYFDAYDWLQHIKAENKQGNITAEECDDIVRKLNITAHDEFSYKILLIWLPEYLGKEGNRLLKLIEEPPEQTLFLLVTENAELILNTILSRTQTLKIPRLTNPDIAQALEQRLFVSPDRATQIAALAGGDYREAQAILHGGDHDNQQYLLRWLTACAHRRAAELDLFVEQIAEAGRESQKNFLRYALHFWQQCLLAQCLPQRAILSKAEAVFAQKLLPTITWQHIESISEMTEKAIYHIERNANPRILFLDLSIRINRYLPKLS